MHYDWNFSVYWQYHSAFLRGIAVTLEVSTLSAVLGTAIGIVLGIVFRIAPFRKTLLFLNDVVRAIPLIVMLFFFYYFPYSDLFGITPFSPFFCAILALALSQAVFTADIVCAAVDNVPSRAIQSARALGMEESTVWRYIILPDILRQILPSLLAFYIGIVKLSSIASVIGCEDVVFATRIVNAQTFRSLEGWIIVGLVYIILVVPLTVMVRYFEQSKWLKRRS